MDLKRYALLLFRWTWLLVIGAILGVAVGFAAGIIQTPIYVAKAKVLVTRSPQAKSVDTIYVNDNYILATYSSLLTTKTNLAKASEELGYEVDSDQVDISTVTDSQVFQVVVQDSNPKHAAEIANKLVEILVAQNNEMQSGRYATTEESLRVQMTKVEDQIASLQSQLNQISEQEIQQQLDEVDAQLTSLETEISSLQKEIATLSISIVPADLALMSEKQARLNQIQPLYSQYQQIRSNLVFLGKPAQSNVDKANMQREQLQSTLTMYQQIYTGLLTSLETVRLLRLQDTPTVIPVEAATPPEDPTSPAKTLYLLLGAIGGLGLGIAAATIIEYLDETLKFPVDVQKYLGLPVLGLISKLPGRAKEPLYALKHPDSPVAEAFRNLRINLEFLGKQKHKTILLLEPDQGAGKMMAAVNLATTFAQAGKRVALVEADLRKPSLLKYLNLAAHPGLGEILADNLDLEAASQPLEGVSGLTLIPGGKALASPLEFIEGAKMAEFLSAVQRKNDIVIVVGPPMFMADVPILATKVDGVLMVTQIRRTSANAAMAAVEKLQHIEANLLGTVVTDIAGKQVYMPVTKTLVSATAPEGGEVGGIIHEGFF